MCTLCDKTLMSSALLYCCARFPVVQSGADLKTLNPSSYPKFLVGLQEGSNELPALHQRRLADGLM